jgi:hypothetical protein
MHTHSYPLSVLLPPTSFLYFSILVLMLSLSVSHASLTRTCYFPFRLSSQLSLPFKRFISQVSLEALLIYFLFLSSSTFPYLSVGYPVSPTHHTDTDHSGSLLNPPWTP